MNNRNLAYDEATNLASHYRAALEKIANLNEESCERYVALADDIACTALAAGDNWIDGVY